MNKLNKKQEILDAFNFRHATKVYDETKKISDEDFNFILETGRLSPSSLGLEPWKILVVQSPELREKLLDITSGAQGQLPTASHFIIILARKNARCDSEYFRSHMKNVHKMDDELIEKLSIAYTNFQENGLKVLESERALFDWASKQTYIQLANMMTAAAQIGIDSTPIEGFSFDAVNSLLENEGLLENGTYAPSVMGAFGYRSEDPKRPKARKDLKDIVKWV